jgi:hypothetical protein
MGWILKSDQACITLRTRMLLSDQFFVHTILRPQPFHYQEVSEEYTPGYHIDFSRTTPGRGSSQGRVHFPLLL